MNLVAPSTLTDRKAVMIEDLIKSNRSCRRFLQGEKIPGDTLRWLVNLARLSASSANLQPLKYILSNEPHKNETIFSCLAWAAYLKDWPGPQEGERPSAYIIMVGDWHIAKNFGTDMGIAAQSILLGARERGLAGCMIGSINKALLQEMIHLPKRFEVLLVIALGKPKESAVIEEMQPGDGIEYWRDARGVHHVPKRPLEEIILSE
jgi:nitroreductase